MAAAVGIVLIFVFGAFAPAVGFLGNTEEQVTSSSVVRKAREVSLKDSVDISYDKSDEQVSSNCYHGSSRCCFQPSSFESGTRVFYRAREEQ